MVATECDRVFLDLALIADFKHFEDDTHVDWTMCYDLVQTIYTVILVYPSVELDFGKETISLLRGWHIAVHLNDNNLPVSDKRCI